MAAFLNLLGFKFDRLTVILYAGKNVFEHTLWLCRCSCGNLVTVTTGNLRNRNTRSCGCIHDETRKSKDNKFIKHGMTNHPSFQTWNSMIQRCKNKYDMDYGGRGIYVCERWLDVVKFIDDMGEKPSGMSIDRIDVDGPYSPDNCRWATDAEQRRNRRNNVKVEYNGEMRNVSDIANELGIDRHTLSKRVKRGDSQEKIFKTRISPNSMMLTYNGETKLLVEFAKEYGMSHQCLRNRIRQNWDIEKALNTPSSLYHSNRDKFPS